MHEQRLSIILAFLALLVWCLLLFPQFNSVVIASAIASLTLPMYRSFRAHTSMPLAISLYFLVLLLCVLLPLIVVTVLVAPQAVSGYQTILKWLSTGLVLPDFIAVYYQDFMELLQRIPGFDEVSTELTGNIKDMLGSLVTTLASVRTLVSGGIGFAGTTFNLFFQIFLIIFMSGLAVIYAPTFFKLLCRVTTLPSESIDRFCKALNSAVRSIFLGIFFVAFIQGLLTGLGLYIFGVKDTAFLTLLATLCAVVPILGTALVWVPVATMLWVQGSPTSAVALVAWGMIIVAGADNFLRPYCLQTGIETSMIVLLFAILSSVIAFGPIGIILGPVLVAFGIQAVRESDYLAHKIN